MKHSTILSSEIASLYLILPIIFLLFCSGDNDKIKTDQKVFDMFIGFTVDEIKATLGDTTHDNYALSNKEDIYCTNLRI